MATKGRNKRRSIGENGACLAAFCGDHRAPPGIEPSREGQQIAVGRLSFDNCIGLALAESARIAERKKAETATTQPSPRLEQVRPEIFKDQEALVTRCDVRLPTPIDVSKVRMQRRKLTRHRHLKWALPATKVRSSRARPSLQVPPQCARNEPAGNQNDTTPSMEINERGETPGISDKKGGDVPAERSRPDVRQVRPPLPPPMIENNSTLGSAVGMEAGEGKENRSSADRSNGNEADCRRPPVPPLIRDWISTPIDRQATHLGHLLDGRLACDESLRQEQVVENMIEGATNRFGKYHTDQQALLHTGRLQRAQRTQRDRDARVLAIGATTSTESSTPSLSQRALEDTLSQSEFDRFLQFGEALVPSPPYITTETADANTGAGPQPAAQATGTGTTNSGAGKKLVPDEPRGRGKERPEEPRGTGSTSGQRRKESPSPAIPPSPVSASVWGGMTGNYYAVLGEMEGETEPPPGKIGTESSGTSGPGGRQKPRKACPATRAGGERAGWSRRERRTWTLADYLPGDSQPRRRKTSRKPERLTHIGEEGPVSARVRCWSERDMGTDATEDLVPHHRRRTGRKNRPFEGLRGLVTDHIPGRCRPTRVPYREHTRSTPPAGPTAGPRPLAQAEGAGTTDPYAAKMHSTGIHLRGQGKRRNHDRPGDMNKAPSTTSAPSPDSPPVSPSRSAKDNEAGTPPPPLSHTVRRV